MIAQTTLSPRDLLRKLNLNPKKSLGQNFLVDQSHLNAIVAAADLQPDDTILEIGPGLGTLTQQLAGQTGRVVAVELDNRLINFLAAHFSHDPHVRLVHGDILKLDVGELMNLTNDVLPYKVVANLPYYITNAVLRHLLEAPHKPKSAVLMMQKEVAERVCAKPGKLSLLAVSVQFYAEPRIIHHVPAGAFYPRPKVDSAVLHLHIPDTPHIANVDEKRFFQIVRAGFGQKRKQLLNSLNSGLHTPKVEIKAALESAQIDPQRRAQTLTLVEWERLYHTLGTD